MEDANRDPVTGECTVEEVVVESNEEVARAESDEEAEDLSEGEEPDANEIDSDDSDAHADSVEAEDPGECVPEEGYKVVPQYSCKKAVDLVNCHFA